MQHHSSSFDNIPQIPERLFVEYVPFACGSCRLAIYGRLLGMVCSFAMVIIYSLRLIFAMEDRTKAEYPHILDDDWKQLGYLNHPAPNFANLQHPIHPIFEYHAWSRPQGKVRVDGKSQGPTYAKGSYNALAKLVEPAFRLASAMLESPASLDFIYQILHGDRVALGPQWHQNGERCWELRSRDTPKTDRRAEAREALKRLAKSLIWQVISPDSSDPLAAYLALTGYITTEFASGINIKDSDDHRTTGLASIIRVNDATLERISNLRSYQDGDDTSRDFMFRLQFNLAVTFCHEITHAVEYGRNKDLLQRRISDRIQREDNSYTGPYPQANEPFFKNQNLAEIGACWENEVFGGQIHLGKGSECPLFLVKWPTFDADLKVPIRRGFKRTSTRYVVPMFFVWNLFRQEFWDKVNGERPGDETALRIKKRFGYRRTCPEGLRQDADWDPNGSSEGEFGTALPTGANRAPNRIDRQIRKIEPDPSYYEANDPDVLNKMAV